jgi:hypothetical protein
VHVVIKPRGGLVGNALFDPNFDDETPLKKTSRPAQGISPTPADRQNVKRAISQLQRRRH